jgi:hypothetical protein
MPEDTSNSNPEPQASSDATQNTGNNSLPQSIPYDRFQQVNEAKKAAEKRLAELEAAEKKRLDDELAANGEYQKLIDDLKPKATRADELEKTVKLLLDAEIEKIPTAMRDLIPPGTVDFQLAWIAQANTKGLFNRTPAPQTDAGATGDKKPAGVKLTPAQQKYARSAGMSDEEYAKHMNP